MSDATATLAMNADDHAFALEIAYTISNSVAERTVDRLFWALDRLTYDRAETEDGRHGRFEATQRIALELDARKVPMRDPRAPSTYQPSPAASHV